MNAPELLAPATAAFAGRLSHAAPQRLRTGIDVVQVSRIRESVASFGARFVERFFTADERAYACAVDDLAPERLAARFAAKEAAIKAFGLTQVGIDWREIEVRRDPIGHCTLRLHGQAAQLAHAPRDEDVALSMSHDGDYAVAIVTATSAFRPGSFPDSPHIHSSLREHHE